MSFILILDERISLLGLELKKIRHERSRKDFYVNFVSQQIGKSINDLIEKNPADHMHVLRQTLSSVPNFISGAFENVEAAEVNILLRISECENIKNQFIAHENKRVQQESITDIEKKKKKAVKKSMQEKEKPKRKRGRKTGERPEKEREVGERPEDNLKDRRNNSKKS